MAIMSKEEREFLLTKLFEIFNDVEKEVALADLQIDSSEQLPSILPEPIDINKPKI